MESSNPKPISLNKHLFDPIRKLWVKKTKEEEIRQDLLKKMVEEWGFPLSLLGVEKELASLPHLQILPSAEIPKRRVDIIAFARHLHPQYPLYPLLIIECKAIKLSRRFLDQVVGYNHRIGAPFLAAANGEQFLLGSFEEEKGRFHFEERYATYQELLANTSTPTSLPVSKTTLLSTALESSRILPGQS